MIGGVHWWMGQNILDRILEAYRRVERVLARAPGYTNDKTAEQRRDLERVREHLGQALYDINTGGMILVRVELRRAYVFAQASGVKTVATAVRRAKERAEGVRIPGRD